MIAGPHGKVYIGSYPDYGLLGGAISVYDPEKEKKRIYRHIVQNQSIASLAYIEKLDLIAAGSSVRGGAGTRAIEKEAKLILWDPKEEKKIFEIIPVIGAKTIFSLAASIDGKLYGLSKEAIFFIDPKNDQLSLVAKPPVPIDSGMAMLGRKIYYGSGANLFEFEIPLDPSTKPAE
jgi:hypothetical protein